ncbi:MAG TPA: hypothetical protein VNM14_23940 [Planctomycetota bacterium]|nr:hypothetical protein [Planctomycetota bacterium]
MIVTFWGGLLLGALLAQADADFGARVRQDVDQLKDDDPGVRQRAANRLAQLGASALPSLEPFLKGDNLDLRGQVRGVIEQIYATDPLYLVRRPNRLVSVALKDAPVPRAIDDLFKPFNVRPNTYRDGVIPLSQWEPITLNLEGATFWQACQAFAKSTATEMEVDSSDGVIFRRPSKTERPAFFTRGPYFLVAKAIRNEGKARLQVCGYPEPGWFLPTATLSIDSIDGSDGRSYRSAFTPLEKSSSFHHGSSFAPACRVAKSEDLPAGVSLSVRGSLVLELPTRVEAIICRPEDLKPPATTTISGSKITLSKLQIDEGGYSYSLDHDGPKDWKAPPAKSFLERFQIILADDQGPLLCPGTCGYAGKGSMSVSSGWPLRQFWRPATRFCLVRILDVEQVTLPYEIQGIELTGPEK